MTKTKKKNKSNYKINHRNKSKYSKKKYSKIKKSKKKYSKIKKSKKKYSKSKKINKFTKAGMNVSLLDQSVEYEEGGEAERSEVEGSEAEGSEAEGSEAEGSEAEPELVSEHSQDELFDDLIKKLADSINYYEELTDKENIVKGLKLMIHVFIIFKFIVKENLIEFSLGDSSKKVAETELSSALQASFEEISDIFESVSKPEERDVLNEAIEPVSEYEPSPESEPGSDERFTGGLLMKIPEIKTEMMREFESLKEELDSGMTEENPNNLYKLFENLLSTDIIRIIIGDETQYMTETEIVDYLSDYLLDEKSKDTMRRKNEEIKNMVNVAKDSGKKAPSVFDYLHKGVQDFFGRKDYKTKIFASSFFSFAKVKEPIKTENLDELLMRLLLNELREEDLSKLDATSFYNLLEKYSPDQFDPKIWEGISSNPQKSMKEDIIPRFSFIPREFKIKLIKTIQKFKGSETNNSMNGLLLFLTLKMNNIMSGGGNPRGSQLGGALFWVMFIPIIIVVIGALLRFLSDKFQERAEKLRMAADLKGSEYIYRIPELKKWPDSIPVGQSWKPDKKISIEKERYIFVTHSIIPKFVMSTSDCLDELGTNAKFINLPYVEPEQEPEPEPEPEPEVDMSTEVESERRILTKQELIDKFLFESEKRKLMVLTHENIKEFAWDAIYNSLVYLTTDYPAFDHFYLGGKSVGRYLNLDWCAPFLMEKFADNSGENSYMNWRLIDLTEVPDEDTKVIGYHMTNRNGLSGILNDEQIRPSSKGMLGKGIYMALNESHVANKANARGAPFILEAEVQLKNPKYSRDRSTAELAQLYKNELLEKKRKMEADPNLKKPGSSALKNIAIYEELIRQIDSNDKYSQESYNKSSSMLIINLSTLKKYCSGFWGLKFNEGNILHCLTTILTQAMGGWISFESIDRRVSAVECFSDSKESGLGLPYIPPPGFKGNKDDSHSYMVDWEELVKVLGISAIWLQDDYRTEKNKKGVVDYKHENPERLLKCDKRNPLRTTDNINPAEFVIQSSLGVPSKLRRNHYDYFQYYSPEYTVMTPSQVKIRKVSRVDSRNYQNDSGRCYRPVIRIEEEIKWSELVEGNNYLKQDFPQLHSNDWCPETVYRKFAEDLKESLRNPRSPMTEMRPEGKLVFNFMYDPPDSTAPPFWQRRMVEQEPETEPEMDESLEV